MNTFETTLLFEKRRTGIEISAAQRNFSYLQQKVNEILIDYKNNIEYEISFRNSRIKDKYILKIEITSSENFGIDRLQQIRANLKDYIARENPIQYGNVRDFSTADLHQLNNDFNLGETMLS